MATNYRIKLVKQDFQLEAEGDKTFVLEMLNRFESEVPHSGTKPSKETKHIAKAGVAEIEEGGKPISIGEFIRLLSLKKHTDIVLAFGYYLEKYSGHREFTPADINSCYYDAKMESSNTSQMIIQLIKRGHIMESKKEKGQGGAKRSYVITHTGEKYIEEKISEVKQ